MLAAGAPGYKGEALCLSFVCPMPLKDSLLSRLEVKSRPQTHCSPKIAELFLLIATLSD